MKSTIEKLCRQAEENGGHVDYLVFNNSLIKSIELGTTEECDYQANPRTIEVWIHTFKKLEDFSDKETFKMIVDNDDIGLEEREKWQKKTGLYDYHCAFFPKAWMEDIWPDFEKQTKEKPVSEQSLAEFALSHGCDYMDMNTMTIYTTRNN